MEEIVVEDEFLPEIEIREVLSLAEMLAFQPTFLAFSWEELHILYQQHFPSMRKVEGWVRLHRSLLEPKNRHLLENVVAALLARRTLRDQGDTLDLLADWERAKQAPNYLLQQREKDALFAPWRSDVPKNRDRQGFEVTPEGEDLPPLHVTLGETEDASVVLPSDGGKLLASAARWSPPLRTSWDHVMDPPLPSRPIPWVPWAAFTGDTVSWIEKHVRPTFAAVLESLPPGHTTLHALARHLEAHGYPWEALSSEQSQHLADHLAQQPEEKETKPQSDKEPGLVRIALRKEGFVEMAGALRGWFTRMQTFSVPDVKANLEAMFGAYLQALPSLPTSLDLPDPYAIAHRLRENTVTSEEVIETMRAWYIRWELDILERFMKRFRMWSVPETAWMERQISWYASLAAASQKPEPLMPFLTTFKDLHEIVEGTDTRTFDGNPRLGVAMAFEEAEAWEEFDASNTVPMTLPRDGTEEQLPPGIADLLSPGAQEVWTVAWAHLQPVAQAAGLPWEGAAYLEEARASILRKARWQGLTEAVPNLPEPIARRMMFPKAAQSLAFARDVLAADTLAQVEMHYPAVHREWEEACFQATVHLSVLWMLDVARRSAGGTLVFVASQAMIPFLSHWSPLGPPWEPDARTGIACYLAALLHHFHPLLPEDKVLRHLRDMASAVYADRVHAIQRLWDSSRDTRRVQDKAKLARLSLLDGIQALKAKKKVQILPMYLRALLYLPGIVTQKKIKTQRWIQGCCATKLDEHFEADADWKETWKDLHLIKQGLAKKRWSHDPHPVLREYAPPPAAEPRTGRGAASAPLHPVAAVEDPVPDLQPPERLDWMPRSIWEMVTDRPAEVSAWAKGIFQKLYEGQKTRIALMTEVLSQWSHTQALLSWMSQVAASRPSPTSSPLPQEIKQWIHRVPRQDPALLPYLQVAFVTLCAFPATLQAGTVMHPSEYSRKELQGFWNAAYQATVPWHKYGRMLTAEEIQSFITHKRESQKQVSLAKLDVLSVEDRQLLQEAKKLQLVQLASVSEISRDALDELMEREGEDEYALFSSDKEGTSDDALDGH